MSGIKSRVDDALTLWQGARHEGAFLSALIAVAAARKRYPRMGDREGFEQFLRDSLGVRISAEYRGQRHPMEHILYKWLRCELVHEGGLPIDIQFMNVTEKESMSVGAGGAPDYVLKVGCGWFHHMIESVVNAVENARDF